MDRLEKARLAINEADAQIARYFEQRMRAVQDVASYKTEHSLPVFDGAREKEVLERNLANISDEKLKPYYEDMLMQLMRISKEYQRAVIKENTAASAPAAD